jgi:hypothetical protein
MRIGLVADIPDQPVAWRIEHIMEGWGELDDAETGPEMAPGLGSRVHGLSLLGELAEPGRAESPQIGRLINPVEQGSGNLFSHPRAYTGGVKKPRNSYV